MLSSLWLASFLACQTPEQEIAAEKDEPAAVTALEQRLEKGGVSSQLRIWPKEPLLGDIIHLELQVTAAEGWSVEMPPFGEALGRFQIVDFEPSEDITADPAVFTQKYRLQAHHSGKQQIPSLRILLSVEGGEEQELLTDELSLTIAGMLDPNAKLELEPPRDKLAYFWAVPTEVWISGGVLLALGLGGLGLVLRSSRKKESLISAFEKAIRDLYALEEAQYPAESLDQFYQKLSMILRRYIEGQFALPAPEQTTEEFLSSINDSDIFDVKEKEFLSSFLRECDGIKFAGQETSIQASREAITAVRVFINEARRKEETTAPEGEPA